MPTAVPERPRADRLFVVAAVLLLAVLGLSATAATGYASASRWVEHTLHVQEELSEWSGILLQIQSDNRGYVASGRATFLEQEAHLLKQERAQRAVLERLLADNPRQVATLAHVVAAADAALEHFRAQIALVSAGHQPEALDQLAQDNGQRLMTDLRSAIAEVRAEEDRLLTERRDQAATGARATWLGAIVTAAAAAGLLAFAWRRERLHEDRVGKLARVARKHLRALSDLAAALASTRTLSDVANVVVEHGLRAAEGDTCTLYRLDDTDKALVLLGHRGIDPVLIEQLGVLRQGQGNPGTYRSFQEGQAVWVENESDYLSLYPSLAAVKVAGRRAKAFWSMPLVAEGRPLGLLGVGFYEPRTFSADERAFVDTLAKQCAQALLRAERAAAEEDARRRNEFLAQAGEALVSSLDYQATLASVARLSVPELADWCAVDLVEPDTARIRQVALAHVDAAKARDAEDLARRFPPPPDAQNGVPQVIRTGKAELYRELPPPLIERAARDAEHLRLLRQLELKSAMIVPLKTRGHCFGAMTFVYAGSERRYTPEDLAFAEDVAHRAAMAIENSVAIKAAEEARARERWLREEAERTNRLKDEFLATASHELRTPLNAILGWTLTLRRGSPDSETDRALAIVERNARAQAKLIEDVLDVSRIVSGKLALHLGPTSVAAATRAAIETISPAADAKNIAIVAEIAAEPLTITADADRLQQVIWNLLSNAVKFTPKDGRVLVRVYRDGSDVCALVKDSGEGIRPELLNAIFEPFQQADSSTTRRHGGLGLGLSIVKQLVAAHGGSVRAESDGPGQGATFLVRLPLRAVAAAADPGSPSAAGHDPLVANAPHARLDGLRVLVVDDEPDARLLVKEILHQHGAEVTVAESAAVARDCLARQLPDVIVSDIGMPEEDGYAFIRRVRESGSRTPAIALTAYASQADAERAFVAGFQKHVAKPVEPARLVGIVANLSGRAL